MVPLASALLPYRVGDDHVEVEIHLSCTSITSALMTPQQCEHAFYTDVRDLVVIFEASCVNLNTCVIVLTVEIVLKFLFCLLSNLNQPLQQ